MVQLGSLFNIELMELFLSALLLYLNSMIDVKKYIIKFKAV